MLHSQVENANTRAHRDQIAGHFVALRNECALELGAEFLQMVLIPRRAHARGKQPAKACGVRFCDDNVPILHRCLLAEASLAATPNKT